MNNGEFQKTKKISEIISKKFQRVNASENILNFYNNYNFKTNYSYRVQIYKQDYTENWTTFMKLKHYRNTQIPDSYFSNPETNKKRRVPGKDGDPYRHEYIAYIMQIHHVKKIKIVVK